MTPTREHRVETLKRIKRQRFNYFNNLNAYLAGVKESETTRFGDIAEKLEIATAKIKVYTHRLEFADRYIGWLEDSSFSSETGMDYLAKAAASEARKYLLAAKTYDELVRGREYTLVAAQIADDVERAEATVLNLD